MPQTNGPLLTRFVIRAEKDMSEGGDRWSPITIAAAPAFKHEHSLHAEKCLHWKRWRGNYGAAGTGCLACHAAFLAAQACSRAEIIPGIWAS